MNLCGHSGTGDIKTASPLLKMCCLVASCQYNWDSSTEDERVHKANNHIEGKMAWTSLHPTKDVKAEAVSSNSTNPVDQTD